MTTLPTIPRCVITGLQSGKSTIIQDSLISNVSKHIPGLVISDVWATDTMPVDLEKKITIENTLLPITPKNGSYFRYVQIPPDTLHVDKTKPHPLMHKTETL